MSIIKLLAVIVSVVCLGAAGALLFNFFGLPYMVASVYFQDLQFVKDYKEGKIVVNKTDQVYIQENTALSDAMVRVKHSLVAIQTGNVLSSGFLATSDGSIVALASFVKPTSKVFFEGQQATFTIVTTDKINNIALLKIDKSNLQTVAFADINSIKLGQKVFLVAPSSSAMDNWVANEGIIRQVNTDTIATTMQDTQVVSGSVLFNVAGQLVGLNTVDVEGRVWALPINKIQTILGL
jgi:S1-C subfamily serine protease